MSADYWLEMDAGGEEPVEVSEWINVTYNLGPMLRAAGFPDWRSLKGAPASEAGGVLVSVADRMRADRDTFEAMNPPNGWGDYDGALKFLDTFADACKRAPKATVGAWL